ncbi:hypothetical protein Tco_0545666 [Tanacetum coccineum]
MKSLTCQEVPSGRISAYRQARPYAARELPHGPSADVDSASRSGLVFSATTYHRPKGLENSVKAHNDPTRRVMLDNLALHQCSLWES